MKPPPVWLGAIIPIVAYFATTRLLGHSQLAGVVTGIVLGLTLVIWRMVATRQVGQIELFTTAILAVSLIPSLIAGEPRIALAAQSIDGFFAASYFLASSFTRKPLVSSIIGPMYVRMYKFTQEMWDQCLNESDRFRKRIRLMSVVCSIAAVTGSSAGLYLALNYPIDTVMVVGPVIGLVVVPTGLLVVKLIDGPLLRELRTLQARAVSARPVRAA